MATLLLKRSDAKAVSSHQSSPLEQHRGPGWLGQGVKEIRLATFWQQRGGCATDWSEMRGQASRYSFHHPPSGRQEILLPFTMSPSSGAAHSPSVEFNCGWRGSGCEIRCLTVPLAQEGLNVTCLFPPTLHSLLYKKNETVKERKFRTIVATVFFFKSMWYNLIFF